MFLMGNVITLEEVDISTIQTMLVSDEFDERIVTPQRLEEIIQTGREIACDKMRSATARSILNCIIDDLMIDLKFMGVTIRG